MRLHFVDRATYRRKADPEVLAGSSVAAADAEECVRRPRGRQQRRMPYAAARSSAASCAARADVVAVACGTGGTLAGLAAGLAARPAGAGRAGAQGRLPGRGDPRPPGGGLRRPGAATGGWTSGFHFGGYARTTPALDTFAADFGTRHGLPVERLYVAKMLYGLVTLAEGRVPPGTTVIA